MGRWVAPKVGDGGRSVMVKWIGLEGGRRGVRERHGQSSEEASSLGEGDWSGMVKR